MLPKECVACGSKEDLHIHHKRYKYPIRITDLVRLCRRCHVEIHQKVPKTHRSTSDGTQKT